MDSLNAESATHPYPCQVTMKTAYGEVKFVYMFADGQTVGVVEMLLANYLKDYLPSDVDFKENYALRLPRSFLQPWEPLRSYGNEFGEVKLLLACRLYGGGKRVEKPDEKDSVKLLKISSRN